MSALRIGILLVFAVVQLHSQSYQTTFPSYDPIPYTGVFSVGERIYRIGLHNIIEMTTDHGETWNSLTPDIPRFNIMRAVTSGSQAVALLHPMFGTPSDWEDSLHTSVLHWTEESLHPEMLEIPWFVPVTNTYSRDLNCDAAGDAIFIIQKFSDAALLRSVNGGADWEQLPLPDSLNSPLFIRFFDRDRGILTASGTVMVTHDAGKHWHETSESVRPSFSFIPRSPVVCWISRDTVLLIDDKNATRMSVDGGLSWSRQSINMNLGEISDLAFLPDGNGYILCRNGQVSRTTDYGKNVVMVRDRKEVMNWGSSWMNVETSRNVLIVDECGLSTRSTDGGLTWTDDRVQDYYEPDRLQLFGMDTVYAKVLPARHQTQKHEYLRTLDGGMHWSRCVDLEGRDWFDVYFATQKVWYSVRQPTESDSTIVLRSSDAGATWNAVFSSSTAAGLTIPRGRCALHENLFVLSTRDTLLVTEDGGRSWRKVEPTGMQGNVDKIEILDEDRWFVLYNKSLAWTNDRGLTWNRHPETDQRWAWKEFVGNEDGRLFLYARDADLRHNRMWKSIDGGMIWDTVEVAQDGQRIRFSHIDENGRSVGLQDRDGEQFVTTTDEWRSFNIEGGCYQNPMRYPYFVNAREGYVTTSMSILKTTNGGVNWTAIIPAPPLTPRILSTWPHPISPARASYIEIDVPVQGRVLIELFDMLGRRRAAIYDAETEAGERILNWIPSGLECGLYMLNLRTAHGTVASKIIIQ